MRILRLFLLVCWIPAVGVGCGGDGGGVVVPEQLSAEDAAARDAQIQQESEAQAKAQAEGAAAAEAAAN